MGLLAIWYSNVFGGQTVAVLPCTILTMKPHVEDGKLAEHWDVLQDEANKAQSVSGLPMFGDRFPE